MKGIQLLMIAAMVSSCAATQVSPTAKRIRLTHTEPTGCEFLGDATGNQGNFLTGAYTSNTNLETGARNDLKNKAAAMGGNVVYLLTNRAGQSGSGGRWGGSTSQTNVTLSGNIYNCPTKISKK